MDDFNRATALILEKLYENFPKKVAPLHLAELEKGIDQETLENFSATAEFLTDEGFIVCGNNMNRGTNISHARLTSKGLATLKMIPEAIDDNEKTSFAEKIEAVIKSGSNKAVNTLITQLISVYVKGGLS